MKREKPVCSKCGGPRGHKSVTGMCRNCALPSAALRPCGGGCGAIRRSWETKYCSNACRPTPPSKTCSYCGVAFPRSMQRKTCSDTCAKAGSVAHTVATRSEAVRARRRLEKAAAYARADKPTVVAILTKKQGGKCASCGDIGKLVLDHNHTTGDARAMLCIQCNAAFGMLKEDPSRIARLETYARRWTS